MRSNCILVVLSNFCPVGLEPHSRHHYGSSASTNILLIFIFVSVICFLIQFSVTNNRNVLTCAHAGRPHLSEWSQMECMVPPHTISSVPGLALLPPSILSLSLSQPSPSPPFAPSVSHASPLLFPSSVTSPYPPTHLYNYRKSWYFFDDEYVALSAGISANANTTIGYLTPLSLSATFSFNFISIPVIFPSSLLSPPLYSPLLSTLPSSLLSPPILAPC